jgi:hypothetical protein
MSQVLVPVREAVAPAAADMRTPGFVCNFVNNISWSTQ